MMGEAESGTVELTAGQHKMNISYMLASNLPTSFKCRNGSIKYKIQMIVERTWKKNPVFEFPFTVIRPLNLNTEAALLKTPLTEELSKNFTLDFTSEPLFMSASIPFRGYVPGQTIHLEILVNNQSKTRVKEIKVSLKKIVSLCSTKPRKAVKELIIPEGKVFTDPVPVLTLQNFKKEIVVPSLPPNISNSQVLSVRYELRVKAVTSGLSRSPKLVLPITIGTVPFMTRGQSIPPSASYLNLRK
jgi:Arrestin (or S-antigen), C-terminal domain/Arrestin (or S-antigen), N-terminal domain